jgi:L-alanine-DL-glutamate epimerase-like enolase superfamily enzyme
VTQDPGAPGERIKAIRATPVNIELEAPYRWSVGAFPGFSKTIVEVETEDGAIGVERLPPRGPHRSSTRRSHRA